jgi:ADP-heptose:LPS heptosyltransferase
MKLLLAPPFGLGDNLMMLPLASILKRELNCEIHILSSNQNGSAELLKFSPHIDKIIEFPLKDYKIKNVLKFMLCNLIKIKTEIKSEKYDFILSLNPNFLRKILLKNEKTVIIQEKEKNQYESSLKFLKNFNIKNRNYKNNLLNFSKDLEKKIMINYNLRKEKYILVNPFGSNRNRSLNDYKKILSKIKNDKNIVLIGKTQEKINHKGIRNLVNKTTLTELAILIKNCKLLVTVDSGPMHIGIIQNKSILAIFKVIHSSFLKPICKKYPYFYPVDLLTEKNSFKLVKKNEKINLKLNERQASEIINEINRFVKNE